jgi:hypothetical protein
VRNTFLSVVVVATLVAAGIGGTFAGFVDTEMSQDNFYQAGISDLLVNGLNDPIGPKLQYTHGAPCKSVDVFIDLYNWGVCQGGDVYMHYKDVVSEEAGTKEHMGIDYVYDGVSPGDPCALDPPPGYREAMGNEPVGPGVWSSEPEKVAEVGDGWVWQIYIPPDDPRLMGEDYASGISEHLSVVTEVCDDGLDGILDDADDNGDGQIDGAEYAAHQWRPVPSLCGKLADIECNKDLLGFLYTQERTWVHIFFHLQQIPDPDWPDPQTMYWRTNALQGDKATWTMMFELVTDP